MSNLELPPERGGAWKKEYHLSTIKRGLFSAPALSFLIEAYKPKSMLEIGCGLGYLVKLARVLGLEAQGIEPYNMGDLSFISDQLEMDASEPFDLGKKFDLVICLEMAEHVPEIDMYKFLANIDRHASDILWFSGAPKGQGGIGHVNERNDWKDLVSSMGFTFNKIITAKIKGMAQTPGIMKNTMIFSRNPYRFGDK